MSIHRLRTFLVVTFALICPAFAHAQNCCMPKLDSNTNAASLINGIQSGTALLIITPYALLFIAGVWIYRRGYKGGPTEPSE